MGYRCVAFDVDGTLLDTERATLESLRTTLREVEGAQWRTEDLTFALGLPNKAALAKLSLRDPEACLRRWKLLERQALERESVVFPGVVETLSALRALGCGAGIVTSRDEAEFSGDRTLSRDLAPWFGAVVLAGMTPRPKPAPDPLLKFMDLMGVRPQELLFVGDTAYDMRCAEDAGVDFALALWGTSDPALPASHRLTVPSDLLALVERQVISTG